MIIAIVLVVGEGLVVAVCACPCIRSIKGVCCVGGLGGKSGNSWVWGKWRGSCRRRVQKVVSGLKNWKICCC